MTGIRAVTLAVAIALMPASSVGAETATSFDYAGFFDEGAELHGVSVETFVKAFDDQNKSEALVASVRAAPATFSNIYFDWEAPEPRFVVQYLGDKPPTLPTELDITMVAVQHSYERLAAVRDELSRYAKVAPTDNGFVSVGVDVKENRVRLGVSAADAPAARQAEQYGDLVHVAVDEPPSPGECKTRLDCPHLRGGIRIQNDEWSCSTGFNGRMPNGNFVHVTAGHCDWSTSKDWFMPNTQNVNPWVGWSTKNALFNAMAFDVLRLRVAATSEVRPSKWNLVYNTDANKNNAIQNTISNSSFFNGMIILKSGISTNTTQGSILGDRLETYYWRNGDKHFFWAWPASYAWKKGDSGGTVWRLLSGYSYLVGFHNGGNAERAIFSSQEDARTALGISYWCLTGSC
jgi:hypothetical protein